ncbi:factor H binding protein domain-containing protein [Rodentibacter haemolyticus]|uniref:Nitrate ABC transporter ATP-binding protein n=1 Tax=Rodentibacter haemolyticus TaxID=2778911 RepID=A0ABX6UW25_9PAST|nr:factor H binding protein domain-containing protein [Rodentibacter haemolyticus]QPB42204.1 nitrate ABC transporter ATP-binding protein [Rodentibacter haemolyticus]
MKKLLLVTALGIVLSACSGGGGGGSSTSPATPAKDNSQSNANSESTAKGSLSSVRSDLQDQVKALKQVSVGGVVIDLASENIGFVEKDLGGNIKGKAYNQAYSAIGYALPKNVKTDQYGRVVDGRASVDDMGEFGLGTKFEDLPATGEYRYSGVSFGANSEGKLSLNVNFADKTLSGAITDRKLLSSGKELFDINLLKTDIRRISQGGEEIHFAGVAKSNVDGYEVRSGYGGKFMGPNAEEVIGYVADDNANPYEAFAGKR